MEASGKTSFLKGFMSPQKTRVLMSQIFVTYCDIFVTYCNIFVTYRKQREHVQNDRPQLYHTPCPVRGKLATVKKL